MMKSIVVMILLLISAFSLAFADSKVYFSPNGGCQEAVITEFSKAKKSIDVAMYYLTAREIAQELVKAQERKVVVRVVLDDGQESQRYSKSRYLIKQGIGVRYHIGTGIMHNKFAVIDGKTLLTGSFNWTPTANEKNEENLLVMTDKKIVQKYVERFEYLWKGSRKGEIQQGMPE